LLLWSSSTDIAVSAYYILKYHCMLVKMFCEKNAARENGDLQSGDVRDPNKKKFLIPDLAIVKVFWQ
jgi:hypothetical protein